MTESRIRKTAQPTPAIIPAEYSAAIFGAKIPEIKTKKKFNESFCFFKGLPGAAAIKPNVT